MIEKIRSAATAIFFVLATVIAILLFPTLRNILLNIEQASKNTAATAKRLDEFVTPEVLKNYDNNLNTSTLTLQQMANDYAGVARDTRDSLKEITAEVKPTMKSANRLIARAADETLPTMNLLLSDIRTGPVDKSNKLFDSAIKITDEGTLMLGEAKLTIAQVRVLLSNPNIVDLIANAADVSGEVSLTAAEVRKAIPELLTELKRIESNVADGTGEVSKYLASFNQPDSRKSKALRFILGILLSNARSLRP